MRRVGTHVAALIGALVGFYAGLAALLAAGGLESAGWAPLFMSAGAGLVSGAAVAIFGESAGTCVWVIGPVGGLVLGAIFTANDPDLTVIAIVLAVFSQALAYLPSSDVPT